MLQLSLGTARELFVYNGEILRWRRSGKIAGCHDRNGYLRVKIASGKQFKVHRIIWLLVTGTMPINEIDHIDGNPSNNRLENLREATRKDNSRNRKHNSRLPWKGITKYREPYRGRKCYAARIRADGKQKHLGYFDCPAAAHFAYIIAANNTFGTFARFK